MRPVDVTELPPIEVRPRAATVRHTMAAAGLDALLVSNLSDVRWMTGFGGSNGWVVLTSDTLTLVTDGRYGDQAVDQLTATSAEGDVVVERTIGEIRSRLVQLTAGHTSIGAQAQHLSHAEWSALEDEIALQPEPNLLRTARRRKDAAELARMQRAAEIAETALADVAPMLTDEPTEADVRDELEYRMRRCGADGPSYDTIVGSGPEQSARPHHRPNRRRIVEGDNVVIDVGALVDGYHSDMTRTFVIGDPSPEQQHRYEAVLAAQLAGLAAVRAGASSVAVDGACRSLLDERGLGDWFVHGTGHGVGLDIHEDPFLRWIDDTELAEGEVVTVEPGVYREGSGGVRIEDLVTITADGHRSLTAFPKDSPCLPSRPTT
ncbi:MAG: aminopeptidase P family protein [Acidimicrobiia bacterium]|jgi:Xaa-Pro aminopeptidase|nr:aminopeptidase P family protein [Acidimicrobiia bacterium]